MFNRISILWFLLLLILTLFPTNSLAQDNPICEGDWRLFLPHLDVGPPQKSEKVYWKRGDFVEYSTIEFHRDKVDFIKKRYLSIGEYSPIGKACEKYGPPFYVIGYDLPEYVMAEIKKYKCKSSKCTRNISANAVTDIRDVLVYDSDSEGFVVDCRYGFLIDIYCAPKTASYIYESHFVRPLINF